MKMDAPTVLLLDPNPESLENISFLLGVAQFQVRCFEDESECLNWLTIMRGNAEEILSILINGELENKKIHDFFTSLEALGHASPVLIVDRFKYVLRKEELFQGAVPKLPVFVCASSEVLVMLNHFKVLQTSLAATKRTFKTLFHH
jgi:FixJ family two-component response regulator